MVLPESVWVTGNSIAPFGAPAGGTANGVGGLLGWQGRGKCLACSTFGAISSRVLANGTAPKRNIHRAFTQSKPERSNNKGHATQ